MAGLVPFNRRRNELVNTGFNDFYDVLDDFFSDGFGLRRSLANDTFKVDVKEDDKGYYIEAELPGVKKEELKISLDEGRLSIGVEREEKVDDENKNYVHRERRYCSMRRSIYLPDADAANVSAKLENGELKVNVPKVEKVVTSVNVEVE
ncbi:MAG TPA: Hsp20/alpha crystallin family protein [Clostridiales bacterium]|jgi:HSP20 family protein|nr:Hsp20/alpha crystallin family protein [Clostridiales bacterium]